MTLTPKQAKQRGRKGGRATSEKKAAAVRENGKLGGRPSIQDEFSDLPVSRQRKHQLRNKKEMKIEPIGETIIGNPPYTITIKTPTGVTWIHHVDAEGKPAGGEYNGIHYNSIDELFDR